MCSRGDPSEMPISDGSVPVKDLVGLLRQSYGDGITIDKVDWKNLTNPGENYGSFILAVNATVTINSKSETLNLVVKLPPTSAWLQELFNSPFTFEKELQFYRDVTPAFLTLQREHGVRDPQETWLGARYYGGRLGLEDPEKFDNQASIVLQNLNYAGFKCFDRLEGLNRAQSEFAVKKLAQLHATAIAMRELKPRAFEDEILPTLYQPASDTAQKCLIEMQQKAADDLKSIPEMACHLESVDKTMKYAAKMMSTEGEESKGHWATLVHNDFWVNNMMFRSDEAGKVLDMKIVDFQLTVYDYGVKDLIFFLMSSPTIEVIDESFDDLVDAYYEGFVQALEALKIDTTAYPKSELLDKLNECGPLKFDQCLMMVQVIKSKPGATPKMEDIKSSETFLSIGGGEIYRRKMMHTVEFFAKRGWLIK